MLLFYGTVLKFLTALTFLIAVNSLTCRVRPIWVSGIGRYSPVTVGIDIGRYLFEYRHRYQ